jgi:hypothetical protein
MMILIGIVIGRVIVGLCFVIAGLTRNPVTAWHWIPDQDAMDASLPRGGKHERVERQEHEQPSFRKRDFE